MTTRSCPFCNPNQTCLLKETERVLVMMSDPRLMKGHLLVIPKRHVEHPWKLTSEELQEIFTYIHRLQKLLSETLGTGCDLRQNYRPFLKEGRLKVDHLHFHLMPRTFEDELYEKSLVYETELFKALQDDEAIDVRKLLG